MVYGTYNYSIHGVSKPTYNWGAPHCRMEEYDQNMRDINGLIERKES